eukprot:scpid97774/ scgid26278/ 
MYSDDVIYTHSATGLIIMTMTSLHTSNGEWRQQHSGYCDVRLAVVVVRPVRPTRGSGWWPARLPAAAGVRLSVERPLLTTAVVTLLGTSRSTTAGVRAEQQQEEKVNYRFRSQRELT